MTDPRFSSIDTFGVYVEEDRQWSCVAICDSPRRVLANILAYQELTRGKVHLMVDRLPRNCDPKVEPTPCGYCGRSHWGRCVGLDKLGNPTE